MWINAPDTSSMPLTNAVLKAENPLAASHGKGSGR